MKQLQDANPKFRVEAVEALGNIAQKNKELIPALAAALKDNGVVPGNKSLKNRAVSVARQASEALGGLGPEAVPALLDVLKDKSSASAQSHAADALGRIGPKAKAAVPLLSQTLKMDSKGVRRSAVRALGQIGPDAKPAIPAMIEILGDYLTSVKFDPKLNKAFSFGMDSIPYDLCEALSKIDPEIQDVLPKNTGKRSDRFLEDQALWQKAYEALRKKYQRGENGKD